MLPNRLQTLTITLLFALLFTACEKKEQPITLPPVNGAAVQGHVDMGENYETQIFYDFESNVVVKTSNFDSWDLSFESSKNGYHIWMNGGKAVFIANSHMTEMKAFTSLPASVNTASFLFDDPSGNADSTAVADWRKVSNTGKPEIYIAKLDDTTFYKFRILSVTDTSYKMEWCSIKSADPQTVTLVKDPAYNFIYFSFTGGVVMPEPPSASWDVVFTRYRYIYRDLKNFPYYVNGVLLNPNHTIAAADSTTTFGAINLSNASAETCTASRDVIGFDWKKYNFTTERYEVNPNKVYILHTRNNQLLKLHFLDFYSATGVKGSPSFEAERFAVAFAQRRLRERKGAKKYPPLRLCINFASLRETLLIRFLLFKQIFLLHHLHLAFIG